MIGKRREVLIFISLTPIYKLLFSSQAFEFMRRRKSREAGLKREITHSIRFNSRELSAINQYCKQFQVKNKAKFMREAIITEVLRKFDENYPTLWNDDQLRLF
jgi:hypothetical protein